MKLSLILLAALAACAVLRSRSAAVRHFLLAAAILCAAALPVVERVVPSLPLALDRPGALQWITADAVSGARGSSAARGSTAIPRAGDRRLQPHPAAPIDVSSVLWLVWIGGAAASLFVLVVGFGRLAWIG
jgi:hypothetical protein